MKKILLTLAIAMSGYCSFAQYLPLTAGSGSPLTGPLNINATANSEISTSNGDFLSIEAFNSSNTIKKPIALAPYGGNVGIGTTTPYSKLDIIGTYSDVSLNANSTAIANFRTPGHVQIAINTQLISPYTTSFQAKHSTADGNSYPIALNPLGGNVGIGTTSPNGKLHVYGTAILSGNTANVDPVSGPALSFLANTGQLLIGWNRTGGGGETDFISNQAEGNLGGFAFYNHDNSNSESKLLQILGNGQVLIGDTQNKQGDYKLAIAGSAIATSVTVKTVTNWPDYVFKPTYTLPSLSQVKYYIDQNQHLPDMPSEQDVVKNGLNLGEVVKIQTKKIEELTLYLIEKDKQVSDQQKEIEQLKEEQKKTAQQETRIATLEKALLKTPATSKQ